MSGGGSSRKNYYGFGKGKGGRKGDPIIWEGPLGPYSFPEPVFEFPHGLHRCIMGHSNLRQHIKVICGQGKEGLDVYIGAPKLKQMLSVSTAELKSFPSLKSLNNSGNSQL